jgi:hypothetical protein
MRNNHPKSELAAMKERAAEAKDKNGLQQSTAREKLTKNRDGRLKSSGPARK